MRAFLISEGVLIKVDEMKSLRERWPGRTDMFLF
jgi:hypothetical protein